MAFATGGAITAVALPPSFEAELGARLASDDINGLLALFGRITTPEDGKQATGLMASRASAGKGFDGLPILLAKAYREAGDAKSARFWLSYGRAVLLVDAQKCTDKTAIDQKYHNTLNTFRDLDRSLESWPPSVRRECSIGLSR